MRMSTEELMQFNADRAARYTQPTATKKKLREELETEMKKFGLKNITVIPGYEPKPKQPSAVVDTSHEYCGNLKNWLICKWVGAGEYNNGRRRRLAETTSLSQSRINRLFTDKKSVMTNAEYAEIKAAIPKVEAMERVAQELLAKKVQVMS